METLAKCDIECPFRECWKKFLMASDFLDNLPPKVSRVFAPDIVFSRTGDCWLCITPYTSICAWIFKLRFLEVGLAFLSESYAEPNIPELLKSRVKNQHLPHSKPPFFLVTS